MSMTYPVMISQSDWIPVMRDQYVICDIEDLSGLKGSDDEDWDDEGVSEKSFGSEETEVAGHLNSSTVRVQGSQERVLVGSVLRTHLDVKPTSQRFKP